MRNLWAVAKMTVLECLRSKFAVIFAALLAVCVLGMGLSFKGDGTLKGRLQTFLDYSTTLTQVLLGLLTLLLASHITARDMRDKTIFTVAAKPLRRTTYVAGRWLGVVLLDAVLLAGSMGAIYALAQYMRSMPTQIERQKSLGRLPPHAWDPDRQAVEGGVFTARARIKPDPVDVAHELARQLEQLFQERNREQLIRDHVRSKMALDNRTVAPDEAEVNTRAKNPAIRQQVLSQIEAHVRERIVEQRRLVRPGGRLRLDFSGVRLPAGKREMLQLVYKLQAIRRPPSDTLRSTWVAANPRTGRARRLLRNDPTETPSSLKIAPEMVTDDHRLTIYYYNGQAGAEPNPTAVKLIPDKITLLCRVGGFEGNVVRAGVIILLRLTFLAAAGVLFGVWMTFPVACLTCLIVFFLGCMGNFVQEATGLPRFEEPGVADYASHGLAKVAFFLVPNLPVVSSPADALRGGTVISWRDLATEAVTGTGLRAMVGLAIGSLIFWRREVAKVQV